MIVRLSEIPSSLIGIEASRRCTLLRAGPWRAAACVSVAQRSKTFKDFTKPKSDRDAEIQCMFWCMHVFDITARFCDFLQSCTGGDVSHSVNLMRSRALACGLLRHPKIWTQNPPSSLSWGFNSPSRHHRINKLEPKLGSGCGLETSPPVVAT